MGAATSADSEDTEAFSTDDEPEGDRLTAAPEGLTCQLGLRGEGWLEEDMGVGGRFDPMTGWCIQTGAGRQLCAFLARAGFFQLYK